MLVQVHHAVAECGRELQDALLNLSGIHRDMPEVFRVARSATTVAEVKNAVDRAMTLVEIARDLIEALTTGRGVATTMPQVAAAARHDLAQGNVLNVDRVRWAAGLLPPGDGWPVLVDALEQADPTVWWGDMPVSELVASFRGVPPHAAEAVLSDAGISTTATFRHCSADDLTRLRTALAAARL